jgi:hypothetical protein
MTVTPSDAPSLVQPSTLLEPSTLAIALETTPHALETNENMFKEYDE